VNEALDEKAAAARTIHIARPNHLPLNDSTRGMIGASQIAQMKSGVIIINTARAAIIVEQPFLEALRTRKIAMAGLDVFWEEPLPANHPFKQQPRVVMTPHNGYAPKRRWSFATAGCSMRSRPIARAASSVAEE